MADKDSARKGREGREHKRDRDSAASYLKSAQDLLGNPLHGVRLGMGNKAQESKGKARRQAPR